MSLSQNLFRVVARLIAIYIHLKPACTSGKCRELTIIFSHSVYRGMSSDNRCLACDLLSVHTAAHLHYVSKHSARILLRYFYFKCIHRLKQDTFRHHESLSHSPVSRLSEITALGVFLMCPACGDGYLHIRDRGSRQHPFEFLFL